MRKTTFRFPVTTLVGSSLKNIAAIHKNHRIERKYIIKFILSKVVAGFFEPFTRFERLLYKNRINEFKPENAPVFIIGFWRSGTTLLHNLLCQDPNAAYTTTFQTVFPNIILSQSRWLKPLTNIFLPKKRPYDNASMDMDFPQEEDFGMMNIQPVTIYKFFLFPADFDKIIEQELFTGKLSDKKLNSWKKAYYSMITKAIINTGGKRYIGKNPCHLARTSLLREMFPGAKFIFIHRHPNQVIESLYQFMHSVFPGVQLQDIPDSFSRENVVMLYKKAMDEYFRDREFIPEQNLIEIKLSEFLKDIPNHLNRIYEKFSLGNFETIKPLIEKYLKNNPNPAHLANPPTKETIELVNQHLIHIMKELGYEEVQLKK